jgi:hypothetical protein
MIAYKLVRKLKSGRLTPLFINKKLGIDLDVWYESECHPTKGFKVRQGWHCTSTPYAPHLTNKGRVWVKVEIEGITEHQRPQNQGGLWYTADWIRFLEVLR